jgi:hypothetical protein
VSAETSSDSLFCAIEAVSRRGAEVFRCLRMGRASQPAGPPAGLCPAAGQGIFTDMSRLKQLWVRPSMLLARRSLIREHMRKKATMEAWKY